MSEENRQRRKQVTINVKSKALEDVTKGVSSSQIAAQLGVHPSTVRAWKKKKEDITEFMSQQSSEVAPKRTRFRKPQNPQVEEALWIWFQQKRGAGIPLSGPLLRAQALKFSAALGQQESFQASEGWLSRWKERHHIRCLSICGEKLSADFEAAQKYKSTFMDLIKTEQLTPDQVFNCDETGLNFRKIPKKTLSAKSESGAPGMKGGKDRITIMACGNASGSLKLPLMVIGKSEKPRALKNITNLPVYYKHQSSAWMTSSLFEAWFNDEFVPKVTEYLLQKGLPLKAVLFMDNCRAHPTSLRQGDIQCVFFPPNTTALIQPMDQGALKCLKMNYSKKLMFYILDSLDKGDNLAQCLKNINMKHVIFWIASAWEEMSSLTIAKSWNKVWPCEQRSTPNNNNNNSNNNNNNSGDRELGDDEGLEGVYEDIEIDYRAVIESFHGSLINENEYQDLTIADVTSWLANPIADHEFLDDEAIIDMVSENKENVEDLIENESDSRPKKSVSLTEAKTAIDIVIEHCDDNGNYASGDILALHRIKNLMIEEEMQQNCNFREEKSNVVTDF